MKINSPLTDVLNTEWRIIRYLISEFAFVFKEQLMTIWYREWGKLIRHLHDLIPAVVIILQNVFLIVYSRMTNM